MSGLGFDYTRICPTCGEDYDLRIGHSCVVRRSRRLRRDLLWEWRRPTSWPVPVTLTLLTAVLVVLLLLCSCSVLELVLP